METLNSDMARFLWLVLREPVGAAVAAAAVFVSLIVLSTWFHFLFSRKKDFS